VHQIGHLRVKAAIDFLAPLIESKREKIKLHSQDRTSRAKHVKLSQKGFHKITKNFTSSHIFLNLRVCSAEGTSLT